MNKNNTPPANKETHPQELVSIDLINSEILSNSNEEHRNVDSTSNLEDLNKTTSHLRINDHEAEGKSTQSLKCDSNVKNHYSQRIPHSETKVDALSFEAISGLQCDQQGMYKCIIWKSIHTIPLPIIPYQGQFHYLQLYPSNSKQKCKYIDTGNILPAIWPLNQFCPVSDAKILYTELKKIFCNNDTVISILTSRSMKQREQIKLEYEKLYKKPLIEEFGNSLSGCTERYTRYFIYTDLELDAYILKDSFRMFTNKDLLRFIMCTRSSDRLTEIKVIYQQMFGISLETKIINHTSGKFGKIMLTLLNQPRDKSNIVDMELAEYQAVQLYSKIKWFESMPEYFLPIFCLSNYNQLMTLFSIFKIKHGITLYEQLKKYSSSNFQKTILQLYLYISNPLNYYCRCIEESTGSKNFALLTAIFVTRADIDLINIKNLYEKLYEISLKDKIYWMCHSNETKGSNRVILYQIYKKLIK